LPCYAGIYGQIGESFRKFAFLKKSILSKALKKFQKSLKELPELRVCATTDEAMTANDEFIPTKRTLLSRLRNVENQESWREFFETYWKLIYGTAIKAGLNDAEAHDVVQETIISVAKNIPEFRYDPAIGSFKTWLLNLTRWRIVDQFRKRDPCLAGGFTDGDTAQTRAIERIADPGGDWLETYWQEEWKKNAMTAALERVKGKIDPKQFQVFDLAAIKEWPVKRIAEALGMSPARIYLTKHRVAKLVQKEIRSMEKKYRISGE
jgi:RNA polymerase sigma factor (sigma-70 family)